MSFPPLPALSDAKMSPLSLVLSTDMITCLNHFFFITGDSSVYSSGTELSICAYDSIGLNYLEFVTTPETSVDITITYSDDSSHTVVSNGLNKISVSKIVRDGSCCLMTPGLSKGIQCHV